MRKTALVMLALCLTAPAAQARRHHYNHDVLARPHQHHTHRMRYVDPPIPLTTVEKAQEPARYKLVKVKPVAPLIFDHSLLFDPAPRLSVHHFSKAAPWAGSLEY